MLLDAPPATPVLGTADCHVWWADPATVTDDCLALLDEAERERIPLLRRTEDRDRFVAGRALLRTAAAGYLGLPPGRVEVVARCPDCSRNHGKPELPGTGLQVSVSHSGARVAVAVTRAGPVGIDVEEISASVTPSELLPHVVGPAEPRTPAHATVSGFHRMWTRKEAVLKATGQGLRVPLSEVGVSAPEEDPRVLFLGGPAARPAEDFVLEDLDAGAGCAAAAAVIGGGPLAFTSYSRSRPSAAAFSSGPPWARRSGR
ncbi:4'-phosphopantetheinyl transferase family protein [Streptomyces sp. NPDC090109]|uniref:4'-phosphopantetheinyl transferase superfamily protein n=1 Tax=unclassified Streptomyces TaxID=2593676 RepID=UPI00136D8A3C|nr:4'-phosphopantetheinyl transferase superfamily protein [Streptomyces sp. S1]MZE56619.1 4'-phosphopantetheinyl transferase superfamily protein [Streptomyces sp. SID5770]